ncbi:MAG: tyrosine transporter [Chlamydiales bacterium]|nr:tyrosine transporter [Chlamydiales bacterium]
MEISTDHQKGSVFGSTLLITGSCIGAGMLGLPVLAAQGGFLPSIIMFCLCWAFMAATGLLLLEVNLWFTGEVSIITMAGRTLGRIGQAFGWVLFCFLFYSLLVAFVSGCGELVADFSEEIFGLAVPLWTGSVLFVVLFGILVYLGTLAVDRFNRVLMAGLIVTYLILVALGIPHIKIDLLRHIDWKASLLALPAMVISFGYHNLVPSITTYLQHDARKLRIAILAGSAIPLLIYLVWMAIVMGLVPLEQFRQALTDGDMATHVLRKASGVKWIVDLSQYFAFFAIVTTLLGVSLSFVDFLADGLHIKKTAAGKASICLLVLAPPLLMGILYPKLFLKALSYAGAFGAVILFGIMPALMVWSGRYREKIARPTMLPGGKPALLLVILFASVIFLLQLAQEVF